MRLIYFLLGLIGFHSPSYRQNRNREYSPYLIKDAQGRLLSPGLIPDNFFDEEMKEYYRLKLSECLKIDISKLDYSLNSLKLIDASITDTSNIDLVRSYSVYLPILSYVAVVIKNNSNCVLYLEKEKLYTDIPEDGYPNVRVVKLMLSFKSSSKTKHNLSHMVGKEFSRNFHNNMTGLININYEFKY